MRNPKARKRTVIGFDSSKGQYSGGNAAKIPSTHARKVRNMVLRDGVWECRPQFTYDSLTNVRGLGLWYDEPNRAYRLIATDINSALYHTFVKGTSGETWSADISSNNSYFGTLLDSTTFRGTWFGISPTAIGSSTPLRVFQYDGTTYIRDAALPFAPYSICTYKDRLFFGGVRFSGVNISDGMAIYAYNPALWTLTNVTSSTITANGTTLYRLTPTSTTASSISLQIPTSIVGYFGYFGQSTVKFRSELRSADYSYNMPVTVQIKYSSVRANTTAYTVGQVITVVASPGFRFRCTVAGTTAGAPPGYTAIVGADTIDGTATFRCDGSDVAAQTETYILNLSEVADIWTATTATAKIPAGANTDITIVIKFSNTATPTITLAPIDFAFLDGLPVSDPRKQNHGQQVTYDDFDYPFFSNETVTNFTIDQPDYLYYSDPLLPTTVKANNYYRLTELPGKITGVRPIGDNDGGRLLVTKRDAHWLFGITEDPDVPILPVGTARTGAGALNPKAIDTAPDGMTYCVGENFIWRTRGDGNIEDICTDAVRSEVIDRSTATWCENQTAPNNRALLTVDDRSKHIYCYTQKGKLFCFDIDHEAWSTIDVGGTDAISPVGYEICDMIYNPNTGNVYCAFGTSAFGTPGLARLDYTQSPAYDQVSNSVNVDTIYAEIWPRPIELSTPRYDLRIDDVRVFSNVTDQTGQTTTAAISFDQGVTFAKSNTVQLLTSTGAYIPTSIPLYQGWATLLLRILHAGKGGRSSFNISMIEADVQVCRGEFKQQKPTEVSNNL